MSSNAASSACSGRLLNVPLAAIDTIDNDGTSSSRCGHVDSERSGSVFTRTFTTMQRVKNVGYDDDDLYDEQDDDYDQDDGATYTAEDKEHFATLTPVIRAELEEVGVQASDKAIEDALWHYYWDVGKSVSYLKSNGTPKSHQQSAEKMAKAKTKSKFDEAAERSAEKAGELQNLFTSSKNSTDANIEIVYWRM